MMLLFGLFDKKAICYLNVLAVNNNMQAFRAFEKEVNTSGTVLNDYPDDFALHYLGVLNDDGSIFTKEAPRVDLEGRACVMNYQRLHDTKASVKEDIPIHSLRD